MRVLKSGIRPDKVVLGLKVFELNIQNVRLEGVNYGGGTVIFPGDGASVRERPNFLLFHL